MPLKHTPLSKRGAVHTAYTFQWGDRGELNPRTWSHNPVHYRCATTTKKRGVLGLETTAEFLTCPSTVSRDYTPEEGRGLEPQCLSASIRFQGGPCP